MSLALDLRSILREDTNMYLLKILRKHIETFVRTRRERNCGKTRSDGTPQINLSWNGMQHTLRIVLAVKLNMLHGVLVLHTQMKYGEIDNDILTFEFNITFRLGLHIFGTQFLRFGDDIFNCEQRSPRNPVRGWDHFEINDAVEVTSTQPVDNLARLSECLRVRRRRERKEIQK